MSGSVSRSVDIAPEAGDALRIGLEHRVDLLDRPEEHADQQQEADEAAGGQLALEDEIAAGNHHDHLDQPHAE